MEKTSVAQIEFGRLAEPLLNIRVIGRQLAQNVSSLQDLNVSLNGLVADANNFRSFCMIPILTVLVGDDLRESATLFVSEVSLC
jgi:hypothetical protein